MKKLLLLLFSVFFLTINYLSADYNYDKGYITVTPGNIEEIKVSIYPNPLTNSQINIEANLEFIGIEILDIVGKTIISENFESPVSKKILRIEDLDKGLYLVRIKFDNKKIYTEKIIIK